MDLDLPDSGCAAHRRSAAGRWSVVRPADRSILVIEDDPATREVLARELVSAGYRVVEAEDARTGLERFAARRPDLVLLDLGLPDRDGRR